MPIFLSCLNDKCKWNQDGLPSFFSLHKVCLEIDYLHCSTKLFFPTWQWLLIFTRKKLFSRDFIPLCIHLSTVFVFIDFSEIAKLQIILSMLYALHNASLDVQVTPIIHTRLIFILFLIFQFVNINFSFRVFAFNLFLGTMFRDLHKLSIFLLCFNY